MGRGPLEEELLHPSSPRVPPKALRPTALPPCPPCSGLPPGSGLPWTLLPPAAEGSCHIPVSPVLPLLGALRAAPLRLKPLVCLKAGPSTVHWEPWLPPSGPPGPCPCCPVSLDTSLHGRISGITWVNSWPASLGP